MRIMMHLGGKGWGDGLTEGRGGLLGLLDVFDHFRRERWCSRGPCRAPVATIFRWATARAGTIGGSAWTGVGMHALHTRPVRTALGCRKRYRSGGHSGSRVFCPPPADGFAGGV